MIRNTSSPVQSVLSFPTSQILLALHPVPLLLPLLNLRPRSRLLNFQTTPTTHTPGSSTPSFPRSTLLAHNLSAPTSPLQAVLLDPSPSSSRSSYPSIPWGLASSPTLLESTQNTLPLLTSRLWWYKLHLPQILAQSRIVIPIKFLNYLLALPSIHLLCITPMCHSTTLQSLQLRPL